MTKTEIRKILESPYDRKIWKNFLQTQFTNNKLNAEDREITLAENTITNKCLSLGNFEINKFTKIGIFEIELNEKVNLSRNRVVLRNLIKDISSQVAGAMVVFVQGEKWRFSYISKRKIKNSDTNLIETQETAPKRYTYLFGKGEKALTAAQRFDKLIQKQKNNLYEFLNLEDFEDAFSVEKLGKEFFKNYKEIYEDFVEYITGSRYVKKGGKWTVTEVHVAHFDFKDIFKNDDKAVRDFFKRMLGRIVFLYFIQKKGWLAVEKGKNWDEGNAEYLYQLYKNAKYKELFYSDYLVPLFFETLNNPMSEDENQNLRFPYLNGGLFDKSQDFQYDKLALPSSIFDKLFENFNNFNFTVYEDAPDEHTIAVDPEMLGHIFENLLEDNKDKGAFYTPKEIVHYMSKESLLAYLISRNGLDNSKNTTAKSALRKIISQEELDESELKFAEKQAFKIIDDLKQVKICDPAIGSGAFPIGLLQEIFNAQIFLMEMSGFTKKVSEAEIKKHIIEESIYGVDIDPGAVDIARLRFWLSLVVDEPIPQPLPNLSFKIVCANTLIPLGQSKGDLGGTNEIADEIEKIRYRYFDANKENKKELEREFRNLQNKLWTTAREWATGEDAEVYRKISEFNPFEDKSCSWFDSWWMFGIKDGFDIIIGNPPYGAKLSSDDKKLYNRIFNYQSYQLDTYLLFVEKGLQLLKTNGVNAYIIPNTWLINLKLEKFRKYIVEYNTILNIVHYHKSVFENAVVDTQIVIIKKHIPNENLVNILEYVDIDHPKITTISQDKWKVLDGDPINIFINENTQGIIDVLKQKCITMSTVCDIFSGIVPYEVGKGKPIQTREMLTKRIYDAEYKVDDSYRELLRGRDINKYVTLWDGKRWIKYGDNLGAPRYSANFDLPEKIVIRQTSDRLIATLDTNKFVCMKNMHVINLKDNNYSLKYILALLNSKLLDFYYETLNPEKGEALAEVKKENVEKLLIVPCTKVEQKPFIKLVDFLLFLYNKDSQKIFTHTNNERVASHVEDVLNMMIYELYFEEHVKDKKVNLDVLQFISPKLNEIEEQSIEDQIKHLYEWYQQPENPIRQRFLLLDTRSPDILSLINKNI